MIKMGPEGEPGEGRSSAHGLESFGNDATLFTKQNLGSAIGMTRPTKELSRRFLISAWEI
jgi:hypothetical protein